MAASIGTGAPTTHVILWGPVRLAVLAFTYRQASAVCFAPAGVNVLAVDPPHAARANGTTSSEVAIRNRTQAP
jgi:hypothetical protein